MPAMSGAAVVDALARGVERRGARRSYARGDLFNKRAGLMQAWADYLAGRKVG